MSPDDPRHGEYRGYMQHRRDGEPSCEPCRLARSRHDKRLRVYGSAKSYVPLGEAAYSIITRTPMRELQDAGLRSSHITRLRRRGPDGIVTKAVRARILDVGGRHLTLIGAQRRLQALAALGWSSTEVGARADVHHDSLNRIKGGRRGHYIHRDVARRIADAYDQLSMTIPPPGKSSNWTRTIAKRHGWLPPLALDDDRIDDPDYKPRARAERPHRPTGEVDEAVVQRVLSGERLETTRAEKAEIVRRWLASGKSEAELCDITGWRGGRYVEREAS